MRFPRRHAVPRATEDSRLETDTERAGLRCRHGELARGEVRAIFGRSQYSVLCKSAVGTGLGRYP